MTARLSIVRGRSLRTLCRLLLLLSTLLAAASATAAPMYRVDYRVGFVPDQGVATVAITLTAGSGHAKRLRFSIDDARHHAFEADGRIEQEEGRLTWWPPQKGGSLRYRYRVDIPRNGAYVARMTPRWALLRIDRLIPPVAVLAPKRAESRALLRFDLPPEWNAVEVGYRINDARDGYPIDNPGRRFQRPLGWMLAGDIGVRRETVEGFAISVAAPRGDTVRRNDILAVINTIALEMRNAFGSLPPKLAIIAAGDPMWRGGLSSPNSLFLHADRPLISENGSSTLVHEMVHVLTRIRGASNRDWIDEGVAEFYAIELLRRSGLLSERRAARAFGWMENHGRKVRRLNAANSRGPRTARAVVLFKALDAEIRDATDDEQGIDDVVQKLIGGGRVSTAMLREAAEEVLGRPAKTLQSPLLD